MELVTLLAQNADSRLIFVYTAYLYMSVRVEQELFSLL